MTGAFSVTPICCMWFHLHVDGLVQERRNAMELLLSCTNPSTCDFLFCGLHYGDIIITNLTIVYSTVYFGADQGKYQSSASLVVVRGIHRWPMNTLHKGPVTRKMFPFDDVIISWSFNSACCTPPATWRPRLYWYLPFLARIWPPHDRKLTTANDG